MTAAPQLASALTGESNVAVRVAMLATLDAVAPNSPAVRDAHLAALRDTEASVRKAGTRFRRCL